MPLIKQITRKKQKYMVKKTKKKHIQKGGFFSWFSKGLPKKKPESPFTQPPPEKNSPVDFNSQEKEYSASELTSILLQKLEEQINYKIDVPDIDLSKTEWVTKLLRLSLKSKKGEKKKAEEKRLEEESIKEETETFIYNDKQEKLARDEIEDAIKRKKTLNLINYCPITDTLPALCKKNIYLQDIQAGNVENIIEIFIKTYSQNKIDFYKNKDNKKNNNINLAFKWGFLLYTQKILTNPLTQGLNQGKQKGTSILKHTLPSFFNFLFDTVLKLINPIVNDSLRQFLQSNEININKCFTLMFPYRLWFDPVLREVMLIFANTIKSDPKCLEFLHNKGYEIEFTENIDEDSENPSYTFKKFRSTTDLFGDISGKDYSEILNYIFDEKKFCNIQIQELLVFSLNKILVSSALFIKDSQIKFSQSPMEAGTLIARFIRGEIIEKI